MKSAGVGTLPSQASSSEIITGALPTSSLEQILANNHALAGSNAQTQAESFAITNNVCTIDGIKNVGLTGINHCNRRFTRVSVPGITFIPSNTTRTSLWSKPPNGALVLDTRFVNDQGFIEGAIPFQHSHVYMGFHAGANDSYESNNFSGPIGLSINAFADSGGTVGQNAKANVVAAQFGATRSAGSDRPVWSMDLNTTYSSYKNNAFGLEIDLNSVAAHDDGLKGFGLDLVCGGGKFRRGTGLNIVGIA